MKSRLLLNREREGAAAASTNPEVPIAHTSKIDIWRPCRPKRALRLWASRTYDAPEMLSAAIAVPLASSAGFLTEQWLTSPYRSKPSSGGGSTSAKERACSGSSSNSSFVRTFGQFTSPYQAEVGKLSEGRSELSTRHKLRDTR